jgi:rod shape-determining protein MreC
MFGFRRFERSTILLIFLLVVSFIVATFDVRTEGGGVGDTLREGAQTLFSPLQQGVDAVTGPVVGFLDSFSELGRLREENAGLRADVQELRQRELESIVTEQELAELRKIHNIDDVLTDDLSTVTARIVSSGSSDFDFVRWIDKGTADGVLVGQAVRDEDGLVGRIDLVAERSARVRLITDPNSGVLVRNLTTLEIGVVDGQGDRSPRLRVFNAEQPVAEGELLATAGTRFPPNIPVGVVIDAAESEAGFQLTTSIDPLVRFNQLDFVQVIVGYSPLDQGDLELDGEGQTAVGGGR